MTTHLKREFNMDIQTWLEKKIRYEKMSRKPIEEEFLTGILTEMCPGELKKYLEMHYEDDSS